MERIYFRSTRKILSVFIFYFLLSTNYAVSQSIYDDVIFISKNSSGSLDSTDYAESIRRISKYFGFSSESIIIDSVALKAKINPYLSKVLESIIENRQLKIEQEIQNNQTANQENINELKKKISDENENIKQYNSLINLIKVNNIDKITLNKNQFELLGKIEGGEKMINLFNYKSLDETEITVNSQIEIDKFLNIVKDSLEQFQKEKEKYEENIISIIKDIEKEFSSLNRSNEIQNKNIIKQISLVFPDYFYVPSTYSTSYENFNFTINGTNQSNLVDGASIFIAKRIKEELILDFNKNFQIFFKESKNIESLLPETFRLLNRSSKENLYHEVNLLTFSNLFKSAFQDDLSQALFRLPDIIGDPKNINSTQVNFIFQFISSLEKISKGQSPAKIISDLSKIDISDSKNENFKNFIILSKYLNVFSESLYEVSNFKEIWLGEQKYLEIMRDSEKLNIYLGLIYQNIVNIDPDNNEILNFLKSDNNFLTVVNKFYQIAHKADEINNLIRIKRQDGIAVELRDLVLFHYIVNDFIFFAMENLSVNGIKYSNNQITQFKSLSNEIYELYSFGLEKNYSQILIHLIQIIDLYCENVNKPCNLNFATGKKFEFLKYLNFMASVASTSNSEELSKVFESVALPPGSYSIKRNNYYSTSLNVYPGLLLGSEFTESTLNAKANFGFTAPVGLSFNFGKEGKSCSLFISIIDLGAPVLFRLSNSSDSGGLPQNVSFTQFISPGISYVYGFKDRPYCLNFGIQHTPQLRTFDSNQQAASVWRINLGFSLDLHLFNLGRVREYKAERCKKKLIS